MSREKLLKAILARQTAHPTAQAFGKRRLALTMRLEQGVSPVRDDARRRRRPPPSRKGPPATAVAPDGAPTFRERRRHRQRRAGPSREGRCHRDRDMGDRNMGDREERADRGSWKPKAPGSKHSAQAGTGRTDGLVHAHPVSDPGQVQMTRIGAPPSTGGRPNVPLAPRPDAGENLRPEWRPVRPRRRAQAQNTQRQGKELAGAGPMTPALTRRESRPCSRR